jgi:hypothetical protein
MARTRSFVHARQPHRTPQSNTRRGPLPPSSPAAGRAPESPCTIYQCVSLHSLCLMRKLSGISYLLALRGLALVCFCRLCPQLGPADVAENCTRKVRFSNTITKRDVCGCGRAQGVYSAYPFSGSTAGGHRVKASPFLTRPAKL